MPDAITNEGLERSTWEDQDQDTLDFACLTRFSCTDLGNANRAASCFEGQSHYVPELGYAVWNRRHWEFEHSEVILHLLGELFRRHRRSLMHGEGDENEGTVKWLKASESRAKLKAAEELLRGEPQIVLEAGEFDRRPYLLNFENGTLDLRDRILRPHDPEDHLTKMLPYPFDESAQSSEFDHFIETITEGDGELASFLQRAVGYSLCGSPTEEVLLFLYGTGANGKSTFSESLKAAFGVYAQKAPPSLLKKSDAVPTDRARLQGKRLVISSELDEKMSLGEAEVKDIVSRETIVARKLHKDFFEFEPTHVLWILGNHRPRVSGTDDGIWRRLLLVPFNVTIPENERDPDLLNNLRRSHLPAIMNWAIEGARHYLEAGLNPPELIREASNAYREDMDVVRRFLSACCCLAPDFQAPVRMLYDCYRDWAQRGGEYPLSNRRFKQRLEELGHVQGRSTTARFWVGIRLNRASPELPPSYRISG